MNACYDTTRFLLTLGLQISFQLDELTIARELFITASNVSEYHEYLHHRLYTNANARSPSFPLLSTPSALSLSLLAFLDRNAHHMPNTHTKASDSVPALTAFPTKYRGASVEG